MSPPPPSHSRTGHTPTENALRYIFVIYDFFGFIVFDLLYIAVIITYTAQCQLVRLYIGTIIDKVLTKLQGYTLEQAMTDISKTYKFLQVVNGKLSALTSLCLLVFLEASFSCESLSFPPSLPLPSLPLSSPSLPPLPPFPPFPPLPPNALL